MKLAVLGVGLIGRLDRLAAPDRSGRSHRLGAEPDPPMKYLSRSGAVDHLWQPRSRPAPTRT